MDTRPDDEYVVASDGERGADWRESYGAEAAQLQVSFDALSNGLGGAGCGGVGDEDFHGVLGGFVANLGYLLLVVIPYGSCLIAFLTKILCNTALMRVHILTHGSDSSDVG